MQSTVKTTADIPKRVMTCQEIEDFVGDGWAIIGNAEHNGSNLVRGELIYFGYDKSEVYQKKITTGHKYLSYRYCGKGDPNVILI